VDLAKQLISVAVAAGCDAVKFQKRTVNIVYAAKELATPRENPFGTTNGDLKYGLEFDTEDYIEIDSFCKSVKIPWFASPWDVTFMCCLTKFVLRACRAIRGPTGRSFPSHWKTCSHFFHVKSFLPT
jgi:N-acetylneuraminate synthase